MKLAKYRPLQAWIVSSTLMLNSPLVIPRETNAAVSPKVSTSSKIGNQRWRVLLPDCGSSIEQSPVLEADGSISGLQRIIPLRKWLLLVSLPYVGLNPQLDDAPLR